MYDIGGTKMHAHLSYKECEPRSMLAGCATESNADDEDYHGNSKGYVHTRASPSLEEICPRRSRKRAVLQSAMRVEDGRSFFHDQKVSPEEHRALASSGRPSIKRPSQRS